MFVNLEAVRYLFIRRTIPWKLGDLAIILIWSLTIYCRLSALKKMSFFLLRTPLRISWKASIPLSLPMGRLELGKLILLLATTLPTKVRRICLIFWAVKKEECCQDLLKWSWILPPKNLTADYLSLSIKSTTKGSLTSITTPILASILGNLRTGKSQFLTLWLSRWQKCKKPSSSWWLAWRIGLQGQLRLILRVPDLTRYSRWH